jgi:hypothetical protein
MNNTADLFSDGRTTLMAGLAADELYSYHPGVEDEFYTNSISLVNHDNLTRWFWSPAYKFIYTTNLAIEELQLATNLSVDVRKRLIAECKFLRAFSYFHLINLFGDVPLTLSSKYELNATLPRESADVVYAQINKDLREAEADLPESYVNGLRSRVNKFAAAALLAKIYLYRKDWSHAEKEASIVIGSGIYQLETDLDAVFLSTSVESIWQLSTVQLSVNTWEGNQILPASDLAEPTYLLRPEALNDFEAGDHRKGSWVAGRTFGGDSIYYPYKYKVFGNYAPITEDYVVLRLADQFLIRAEARAEQNDLVGSLQDLNVVRTRAGLPEYSTASQTDLLNMVYHERRIELLAEWGNRWYDLKRTNLANTILGTLKPDSWKSSAQLWPIPQNEINQNTALTQNPGY